MMPIPGIGTIINVITVTLGTAIGLLLRGRLSEHYKTVILQGVGVLTLVIGIQMALKTDNILLLLASVIIGGLLGQFWLLEERLDRFADQLKKRFSKENDHFFSEGFITASIIFCVGPMTIIGSLNDGLRADIDLLAIKSVLDGFTALALATSFGIGVLFSIFTIIIIQGGITLSAVFLDRIITDVMINEMTAAGGVLIIGIGLLILDIKKIKVMTLLPALLMAPVFALLYQYLSSFF